MKIIMINVEIRKEAKCVNWDNKSFSKNLNIKHKSNVKFTFYFIHPL